MESNQKRKKIVVIGGLILLVGLCLLTSFTVLGSGLGLWFVYGSAAESPRPTPRVTRQISMAPTFTPTATPTLLPTATPTLTVTPTPLPTATPPPTPDPPTPTLPPPTDTPLPAPAPPTATPPPTDTPVPSYPFEIIETGQFPTNHESFDVYIAVTNKDNKPVSGYRVLGTHSSGDQKESQTSAGDWTANSGAMHYKAGNIKYEVPKSPGGVWRLQLVDQAGTPVAPPVEFPYDPGSPTWYFLLYRLAG